MYGDEAMPRSRLFEWCKRFKKGREDVKDDPSSGMPSTSKTDVNIKHVRQMLRKDRRLTVRMLARLQKDPSGAASLSARQEAKDMECQHVTASP